MRTKLILSLTLAVFLVFSGSVLSQEEKADREAYEKAKKLIYQKSWESAIANLESFLEKYRDSDYLPESLYWLGYSMDQLSEKLKDMEGQLELKEEAIARLNSLIKQHASSHWADDARVLRVKIAEALVNKGLSNFRVYINGSLKHLEGLELPEDLLDLEELKKYEHSVDFPELDIDIDPEELEALAHLDKKIDPDLELKLIALSALMNVDAEKAFPILEKIIQEGKNPALRQKAVFVLSQSRHAGVEPIMKKLATTPDPDKKIQELAILYFGNKKDEASLQTLIQVYDSTTDSQIKERVVFALSQHRIKKAKDKLVDIALKEKDSRARSMAIMTLGQNRDDQSLNLLLQIYERDSDPAVKEMIVLSLAAYKDKKAKDKIIDIVKNEKNLKIRQIAIYHLGQDKSPEILNLLVDLYRKADEKGLKRRLIHAIGQNKSKEAVSYMIDIARQEKDPSIKKTIILWLSQSKDEEALKFLKEIIEK